MAFMRAEISDSTETWVLTDHASMEMRTCFPDGYYEYLDDEELAELAEAVGVDADQMIAERSRIYDELGEGVFVVMTGYRGWLSAPGYLDRTDLVICHTQRDVAKSLLESYYDNEVTDMDNDELQDMMWLSVLADEEELFHEVEAELNGRDAL